METLKKNIKYVGIGVCLIGIISVFLPLITISLLNQSETINYFKGDGKILLVAFIIEMVLFYKGKKLPNIIISAIFLALFIYETSDVSNMVEGTIVNSSFGIGYYLILISLIFSIGAAVLMLIWKIDSKNNNVAISAEKQELLQNVNNIPTNNINTINTNQMGAQPEVLDTTTSPVTENINNVTPTPSVVAEPTNVVTNPTPTPTTNETPSVDIFNTAPTDNTTVQNNINETQVVNNQPPVDNNINPQQ